MYSIGTERYREIWYNYIRLSYSARRANLRMLLDLRAA